jgi:hypothetical protein
LVSGSFEGLAACGEFPVKLFSLHGEEYIYLCVLVHPNSCI